MTNNYVKTCEVGCQEQLLIVHPGQYQVVRFCVPSPCKPLSFHVPQEMATSIQVEATEMFDDLNGHVTVFLRIRNLSTKPLELKWLRMRYRAEAEHTETDAQILRRVGHLVNVN